jgi:TraM recognition site of TraD and TraG
MTERILNSKTFISFMLAAITWTVLHSLYPFPAGNLYLQLISYKDPAIYSAILWTYSVMMFTTPFIIYSSVFSGIYTFAYRHGRTPKAAPLPLYPDPRSRESLYLVLSEVHHPTKPIPGPAPYWLTIPERGLFTGIAIFGAIGSGKTSCCMRPYLEQLLAFKAHDPGKRIGGLVLEVKGDFCHQVRQIMADHGREEDYIEISLDSEYRYNPLHNDLDAYALAYGIASLLNNLFGRGKEPFWQQAYTNLVKFIILLHKVAYDYVTFFDIYECTISPSVLERKITQAEMAIPSQEYILIEGTVYKQLRSNPENKIPTFEYDPQLQKYKHPASRKLEETLDDLEPPIHYETLSEPAPGCDQFKWEQLEAVKRWFHNDWMKIEPKLRTSIVEGISVFLSLFDDNPKVKRVFCPPKETYDPQRNTVDASGRYKYGRPLPSFGWLIEQGKVSALNFPMSLNAGMAKAIGTMMKLDFQRAVLMRIPEMESHPERYFRQVFFVCDEYQAFATVGENDPNGDEKFFSLSRQPKCIPIIATQSISSLKSTLPGDSYRTLLQTFRTKIFLALSDEFSTKIASELCGKEDKPFISYTISESGQQAHVSLLTGKTVSDKDSLSASKNYSLRHDFRFEQKVFAELANAQAIVIPYDGLNPYPAIRCYLKPYYRDPNVSYFEQLKRGWL